MLTDGATESIVSFPRVTNCPRTISSKLAMRIGSESGSMSTVLSGEALLSCTLGMSGKVLYFST